MNKIARHSFIILILIFLAILSANFVLADGCCYKESVPECTLYYQFTQDVCLDVSGNKYSSDPTCSDLPECEYVCCCKTLSPYTDHYTIRGHCEKMESLGEVDHWIYTTEGACNIDYCSGAIPKCNDNCQLNYQDCIGINGLTQAGGKSYCWENGEVYSSQTTCTIECVTQVQDCIRDREIDQLCICDGFEYDSGYCCPDGTWKQLGEDCLRNGCTIDKGYMCVSGCDNSGGHDASFDNTSIPGGCPEDKPYCCEIEAPSYVGCCLINYELCTGTIFDSSNYFYSLCNPDITPDRQPCSVECERLNCSLGYQINSGINVHQFLEYCYCDGDYYSITGDTGYCCDDGTLDGKYQTYSCIIETGNISGYVYNVTDYNKIAEAKVDARRLGHLIKTTYTDEGGDYILKDLPYGDYTIFASKEGFSSNYIDVGLTIPQLSNQVIGLMPYIEGPCDSFNPPAPDITANPVKGKALVNLTWNISCYNVNEFIISRNPEHPLGEIKTDKLFFMDENVSWGQTYTYSIKAHYTTNAISGPGEDEIELGNELCEGIFGDEEFCLNEDDEKGEVNIYRYTCDETNSLERVNDGDCILEIGDSGVCVGPDENNKTKCVYKPDDCKEVEPFKPFGLYYDKDSCLGDGDNWCYYDYSLTTIDKCDNCEGITCYDYKSEEACLEDNCGAGGVYINREEGYNSGCEWIDLWEEFGKGICYDPDFDGEKCGLCNSEDGVFYNMGCNQEICSALGNCYSDLTSCFECSEEIGSRTTCETYNSKEACIGANEQEIDFENNGCDANVPVKIIPSNDACNLGVCKWDDDICYKDADGDNQKDCTSETCEKDLKAPITEAEKYIPNMNASGYYINFTAYDDVHEGSEPDKFYYCVDKDNICCPTNQENFVDGSVLINPVEHLTDYVGAGIYYIRYYSADDHKNLEEVKSLAVYIDKTPPPYSIVTMVQAQTETLSSLTIDLSSDEFISCSYSSPNLPSDNIVMNEFVEGRINKTFKLIFEYLEDGPYILTTICKDDVGNTNVSDWDILVDNVQQIRNAYPNFITLNKNDIELYVETTDDSICVAKGIEGYSGEIELQQTPIDSNNFTHTYLGTFNDGTYNFEVNCTPVLGTKLPDRDFIIFTVDKIAPITTATKGGDDFDFSVWHRTPLTIELECNDVDQGDQPGEFGCDDDNIRYCLSTFPCDPVYNMESPSIVSVTGDNTLYFRYYSVDDGGNMEELIDRTIMIDNDAPVLEIDPISSVVDESAIIISGSWSDAKSGIEKISINVIDDQTNDFTSYEAQLLSDNKFTKTVILYGGSNTILIAAEDNAGGIGEYTLQTFYDVYGPTIVAGVFDHEGWKIDNNFGGLSAEYGESINFSALITDIAGVDRSEITIECNQLSTTSCASHTGTFDLIQNEDYFSRIISDISPAGNYTVTFKAWDDFGNYNETKLWFLVEDTTPPLLDLIPELPSTVYMQSYDITGITDPNLQVIVTILDEEWGNPEYYYGTSDDAATPKEGFEDKQMGDIVFNYQYPLEGESLLMFKGDWSGVLFIGDYLEFSNNRYKIPRYEIVDRTVFSVGFEPVTRITISPPLEENVDSSIYTVSAFTSAYPAGWFNIPINFREGINNVVVSVMESSGSSIDITGQVRYDTGDFDIILTNPSDGSISYTDFTNAGNAIPLQIETEGDSANFRTSCKISHLDNDIIAEEFTDKLMATTDNIVHTFTINYDLCKENNGYYCLIGGTSQYQFNYHHYRINCTPVDSEYLTMGSKSEDICFTAATYGMQNEQERGANICTGSTGCGSSVPSQCAGAIDCQDVSHSSSQSNCISEGICKWSVGYGCGVTCYSGFVDDDNDGVCTEPSINCADYDGNKDSCLSQSICKWCPSTATSNANKCLQNSCDSCGSLTYDSDPLDGECDDGGEGIGGWDI